MTATAQLLNWLSIILEADATGDPVTPLGAAMGPSNLEHLRELCAGAWREVYPEMPVPKGFGKDRKT